MPERFPTEQSSDNNSELTREEILSLRKERKEKLRQEKNLALEKKVEDTVFRFKIALIPKDLKIEDLGPDAEKNISTKIRNYYLKNPDGVIDMLNLSDAVAENPECINDKRTGIVGILEAHIRRVMLSIAERRKEIQKSDFDPYEALFESDSGDYYLARLTRIEHLQDESNEMRNCVGESEFYLNRIKKGEIEILSFRHTPKFDEETGMLEKDYPVLTIEYRRKEKRIYQIKKFADQYLNGKEDFMKDFIDVLNKLNSVQTSPDESPGVESIQQYELHYLNVDDYHIYTREGQVHFSEYDKDKHGFILKMGKMPIEPETSKEDAVKIFNFIEGTNFKIENFATSKTEVSDKTELYIGPLYPGIFQDLPDSIEHVYTKYPNEKIDIRDIILPETPKTPEDYKQEFDRNGIVLINNNLLDFLELRPGVLQQGKGDRFRIARISPESLKTIENQESEDGDFNIEEALNKLNLELKILPIPAVLEFRLNFKEKHMHDETVINIEVTDIGLVEIDKIVFSYDDRGYHIFLTDSELDWSMRSTHPVLIQI